MYIPYFASALIDNPKVAPNLKGVLIGNGAIILDGNWRRFAGNKFLSNHYYFGP